MGQLIDLGKIRFHFRGAYSASASYELNDVVRYGANAYLYINPTLSSGNDPETNAYWEVMTSGIQYENQWSSSASYQLNDLVSHGPKTYLCIDTHSNQRPPNNLYWSVFADGIDFVGDWLSASVYYPGQIVKLGASQYIAELFHTAGDFGTDLSANRWSEFARGLRFVGVFGEGENYLKDDIVTDGVDTYICISSHASNTIADLENEVLWTIFNSGADNLPTQLGQSGKLLSTDGSNPYWSDSLNSSGSVAFAKLRDGSDGYAHMLTGSAAQVMASAGFNGEFFTNPIAILSTNTDDYAQLAIVNTGDGANTSTDIILYGSNGNDTSGWIDMGITSPSFDDPEFSITGPGNGYIFMSGADGSGDTGNLIIATDSTGTENRIIFGAGGLATNNAQMIVIPDDRVHIEIDTQSTSPSTGALTVLGGMGVQGNLNVLGNTGIVGDIVINGSLSVAGGAFQTETQVSPTPLFITNQETTDDLKDTGYLVETKSTSSSAGFNVGTKAVTASVATLTRKTWGTIAKSVSGNLGTIVINGTHDILVGETVTLENIDSDFNGDRIVTAKSANTISFTLDVPDVSPVAALGTVKPKISTEFIVGDRVDIVGMGNPFDGAKVVSELTSYSVSFPLNVTASAAVSASGTVSVTTKTKYTGLVRNYESGIWTLVGNIGPAAPTSQIDFSDPALTYGTLRIQELQSTKVVAPQLNVFANASDRDFKLPAPVDGTLIYDQELYDYYGYVGSASAYRPLSVKADNDQSILAARIFG